MPGAAGEAASEAEEELAFFSGAARSAHRRSARRPCSRGSWGGVLAASLDRTARTSRSQSPRWRVKKNGTDG